MSLLSWAETKVRKMSIWDVSVLKICVASFVLMVAKLWPPLISLDWYCYAGIFVPAYVYLIFKLYVLK